MIKQLDVFKEIGNIETGSIVSALAILPGKNMRRMLRLLHLIPANHRLPPIPHRVLSSLSRKETRSLRTSTFGRYNFFVNTDFLGLEG